MGKAQFICVEFRNIAIIAHVDHGKTTLVDAMLKQSGQFRQAQLKGEQILDANDLERERGITIKSNTITLSYRGPDGQDYLLNLIDTPGHVDFSYEVSRSLAACEGALLIVDASQGVEAQSVANCYTAIEQGLEVIPVLNKIDLPSAEPERVKQEIEDIIGIEAADAITASAVPGDRSRTTRYPTDSTAAATPAGDWSPEATNACGARTAGPAALAFVTAHRRCASWA